MRALIAALAILLAAPVDATPGSADAAIAAARARALASHKRLLIDLGADWCLGCRRLAATLRSPAVAALVARHYEVVRVDVGRFDRNLDIPDRLGFHGRRLFLPAVIVVDPARHRIVNHGEEMALVDPNASSVARWLARWAS